MSNLTEKFTGKPILKAKPVSATEMKSFEQELGLVFPKPYAEFLAQYGCVSMGSKEIYGICGDNSSVPSAIHATTTAREDGKFPTNLIVIADNGAGRKFCLDPEGMVHFHDFGRLTPLNKDFETFVIEWFNL